MSGVTPSYISRFRDLLGTRGYDMGKLADDVGCSRHHLSQIIWGHFKGDNYWPRIRACVSAEEWAELLHVENCATWNSAQTETEAWLMRVLCAWCGARMGFRACLRVQAGLVSHGICSPCYTAQMADLDQLAARQVDHDVTAESFLDLSRSNNEDENVTPAPVRA